MERLLSYLYIIPASLLAIIFHELSHALVSTWLGDPTPKETGRLSFNPLKHLDIFGIISLILFHVGWAKPVMIDPRYYKKPRLGMFLVSLAGPLMNFILAFISGSLAVLFLFVINNEALNVTLGNFFLYFLIINVGLGLFNLIPIPPLDGSKVIGSMLPPNVYYQYMKYERYGMFFLLIIILLVNVLEYMGLPNVLTFVIDKIYIFIMNIWANIFGVI